MGRVSAPIRHRRTVTNGMEGPTHNGIEVPQWMSRQRVHRAIDVRCRKRASGRTCEFAAGHALGRLRQKRCVARLTGREAGAVIGRSKQRKPFSRQKPPLTHLRNCTQSDADNQDRPSNVRFWPKWRCQRPLRRHRPEGEAALRSMATLEASFRTRGEWRLPAANAPFRATCSPASPLRAMAVSAKRTVTAPFRTQSERSRCQRRRPLCSVTDRSPSPGERSSASLSRRLVRRRRSQEGQQCLEKLTTGLPTRNLIRALTSHRRSPAVPRCVRSVGIKTVCSYVQSPQWPARRIGTMFD